MSLMYRPSSSYLRLNSVMYSSVPLTNAAANYTISSVYIPQYSGTLLEATLELEISQIKDTSGAENYINSDTYIQVHDGTNWQDAIYMGTGQLRCTASTIMKGATYYGDVNPSGIDHDIKSYLTKGADLLVRWENAKVLANNLYLYGVYSHVNLYFE